MTIKSITRLNNGHRAFLCERDCGNTTAIEPIVWKNGIVKSCGCFAKSLRLEHSEELDRLRVIYNGMVQRCCNKNSSNYKNYGGRGISICNDWLEDRQKFINWANVEKMSRSDMGLHIGEASWKRLVIVFNVITQS